MPRGRPKGSKNLTRKEKKTPCKIRPIEREHAGKRTEPWVILEGLIEEVPHFADLKAAKWTLLWRKDWKPDIDGVTTLAMVRRASELDRTLLGQTLADGLDLVLLLAEAAWQGMSAEDRKYVVFHELCHPKASRDSNGNQKVDTRDRLQWRLRKHPIVAFPEEIEACGIASVLRTGERAATAARHAERPMEKVFDAADAAEGNGEQPMNADEESSASIAPGVENTPAAAASPLGILRWERRCVNGVCSVVPIYEETADQTDDNSPVPPVDPNAWKRMPVKVLELKPQVTQALVEARLTTLNKLSIHMTEEGQWWARPLKGIGDAASEQIENAFVTFWAAHPEFCRPAVEAEESLI